MYIYIYIYIYIFYHHLSIDIKTPIIAECYFKYNNENILSPLL